MYVCLTKPVQNISGMMAVAVNFFQYFLWYTFLIKH